MKKGYFSVGTAALLSLGLFTSTYAADACSDAMGHSGNGMKVNVSCGNDGSCQGLGKISGTSWGLEEWYSGGGNNSMTYYSNGTFSAEWSGAGDFLARVGFQYDNNLVDHKTKHYAVDYKYTKQSQSAGYGYIGVYGWTRNPDVEYYIVDDWYSQPNDQYIGPSFGTFTVDGGTYSVHAFIRDNEYSKLGQSTFLQIFSVRETPRQCGHIDISAHFKKWDELFHGQTENLPTSKNGHMNYTVGFGKLMEVMLMSEAGGSATGKIDYTYFNMVDNAEGSTVTSSASTNPTSSASTPTSSAAAQTAVGTLPGKIEFEDYQNKDGGFTNGGTYLGDIEPGNWAEYTVNVTYTGTYTFELSAARGDDQDRTTSIDLVVDGTNVGTISDILTDGWDDYKSFTGVTTSLSAGTHTLRVEFTGGYVNVDNITFTEKDVDKGSKYEPPASIRNVHLSLNSDKELQVFDMQGRNLGRVSVAAGASLQDALFARFHKSGIYLVKQGSQMMRVRVTR